MIESGVYLTPYGGSGRQMKPRVTENCFAALVRTFKTSDHFLKDLRPASQALWGRELDFACRPNLLGAISLDEIRPALVQQYLEGWSDKPGKQAAALAAFRALEKWAIVRDLLARPITLGVETGKPTGSHVPWTDEQVALAESNARDDLRRVITLGANTGQRGSDPVRKTGRELWVPILEPLRRAMETWERRP